MWARQSSGSTRCCLFCVIYVIINGCVLTLLGISFTASFSGALSVVGPVLLTVGILLVVLGSCVCVYKQRQVKREFRERQAEQAEGGITHHAPIVSGVTPGGVPLGVTAYAPQSAGPPQGQHPGQYQPPPGQYPGQNPPGEYTAQQGQAAPYSDDGSRYKSDAPPAYQDVV